MQNTRFTTVEADGFYGPFFGKLVQEGVTDGSLAEPGIVGEVMSNTNEGVTVNEGAFSQIATITLTAGDWDLSGVAEYDGLGGISGILAISTTSASDSGTVRGQSKIIYTISNSKGSACLAPFRVSLTTNTTYYLNLSLIAFPGESGVGAGTIRARRMR